MNNLTNKEINYINETSAKLLEKFDVIRPTVGNIFIDLQCIGEKPEIIRKSRADINAEYVDLQELVEDAIDNGLVVPEVEVVD